MPFRRSLVFVFALACFALLAVPAAHAQSADILVAKNGPSESAADTDVAYDVMIANAGPDDGANVMLTDPIPVGMTFVSVTQASGPAFSCSAPSVGSGGTIACSIATLAHGVSADFTVTLHIGPAEPAGTTFTNTATGSTVTFDPNDENNSGTAATTVPSTTAADVGVVKNGPSAALPDSDVTYQISVENSGPNDAQSVTFTDLLPGTLTFVSLSQNDGPAFSCTTPAAGAGGTITCSIASLVDGAGADFTLVAHVPPGTPVGTTYSNTVIVNSDDDENAENDESSTTLTVSSSDLAVTKTGPATITAGQTATYTIVATNNGPNTATAVQLVDVLDPEFTFVSIHQDSGPPFNCSAPVVGQNGTIVCTAASFANAATAQFTLIVTLDPNYPDAGTANNTVTISSGSSDANTANNSATASSATGINSDLGMTKTGPANVVAGATITYSLGITNSGPSAANPGYFVDTLPSGTTFVSLQQNSGATFNCSTPAVGAGGAVQCQLNAMPVGASATFTLVVATSSGTASGTIVTNTAMTDTGVDLNPVNNMAQATTTITTSADVAVTKTAPAGTTAGVGFSYTVTVTNNGPSDAQTVTLTDIIPANTTFASETQTSGPTFICTTPAVGGTGTVTCSIASLSNGASATFTIGVTTDPAATTSTVISNTATVTTATSDPNIGNNSATATTTVTGGDADLSITKTTTTTDPVPAGTNVTYTITVANAGPADALNTTVTDVLPANTSFVSATPSQGTCSGTTTVTCVLGTLAPSANATITLVVQAGTAPGPVVNSATVTAANNDPVTTNNTSTATFAVAQPLNIPTTSPLGLALMAMAIAALGALALKIRA